VSNQRLKELVYVFPKVLVNILVKGLVNQLVKVLAVVLVFLLDDRKRGQSRGLGSTQDLPGYGVGQIEIRYFKKVLVLLF